MEIVKREFIYRENTKLGPVEFKAFINRHVRKLRAREDVCKVSGNITDDYSKCVVKYTMIMPDLFWTMLSIDIEIEGINYIKE